MNNTLPTRVRPGDIWQIGSAMLTVGQGESPQGLVGLSLILNRLEFLEGMPARLIRNDSNTTEHNLRPAPFATADVFVAKMYHKVASPPKQNANIYPMPANIL